MTGAHPGAAAIAPIALDHVALRVADRDAMTAFLRDHLGMHELRRTDGSTLVGADARHGKLNLLAADGPRERGALERVVLRVADLDRALASLPPGIEVEELSADLATFRGPEGLGLGLTPVAGGGTDYDIDHVSLRVADPDDATIALAELGFVPRGGALHVADKRVRLAEGPPAATDRPVLDHIGLLVESLEAVSEQARRRGLEVGEQAPNAVTVYVRGPERISVQFLEQTPSH